MKSIFNFLKEKLNNEGATLVIVIMVFTVLTILFASTIMVTQTNTNQIDSQEDHLRAYYVARSGIDIAYAALMQNNKEHFNLLLSEEEEISHNGLNVPQVNPIGTVDIKVSIVGDEVKIHADAQIIDDDENFQLSLFLDKDNIEKRRWENK